MFITLRNKFSNRIAKNSIFALVDQILNIGMNFILYVLMARFLGVTSLGQYSLGLSIVGLFSIFTNFGIMTITNREIAKDPNKIYTYLGNALGIKFLISTPLLLLSVFIFLKIFNYGYQTSYIVMLIAVYNVFITSIGYIGSSFVSLHKNDILLKINVFNKLLILIGSSIFLYLGYSLMHVLYIFIIVSFGGFLYALYNLKKFFPDFKLKFQIRFIKPFIFISFPLILAGAAEYVNLKIDTVFIGNMLGEKSVGIYSAAYNILMGSTLLPLTLTKVYFPNFVDYYKYNKNKAFNLLYQYNRYFITYSLFIGLIMFVFADFIINLVYGDKFYQSIEVLRYLSFALIVLVLNRLYNYTLLALKENNYYFKITLIGTIVNLILNYFLILRYGILGAVIATIFTEFIVFVLSYKKILDYRNENKKYSI